MFKYDIAPEKSTEEIEAVLSIGFFSFLMILLGYIKFLEWWEKRKKDSNPEEIAIARRRLIRREQIVKFFDDLNKIPDNVLDKMLDVKVAEVYKVGPSNIESDIKFYDELLKFYNSTVHPLRMRVCKCKPEDISGWKGEYKTLVESKLFNVTFDGYGVGKDNKAVTPFAYDYLPKSVEPVLKKLVQPAHGETLKDLGWNKSNLRILRDHILKFFYDNEKVIDKINREDDQFYSEVLKIVKSVGQIDGWWEDDESDEENIQHADGDDGIIAYTFGQDPGFFFEFNYSLTDGTASCSSFGMLIILCQQAKKYKAEIVDLLK